MLLLFLLIAVFTDHKWGKIYNGQVVIGIFLGVGYRIFMLGPPAVWEGILSFLIPVVLLFPLFRIGTLGGGDIKLLAVAALFLTPYQTILFLGVTFFFGAVGALFKMIKERNFAERFSYLMSYVCDVITTNNWKLYEDAKKQSKEELYRHKIHFALPVFVSALIHAGGLY